MSRYTLTPEDYLDIRKTIDPFKEPEAYKKALEERSKYMASQMTTYGETRNTNKTRTIFNKTINMSDYLGNRVNAAEFNAVLDYYLKYGTYPKYQESIKGIALQKNLNQAVENVKACLTANHITDDMVKQAVINEGRVIKGDTDEYDYEELNRQTQEAIDNSSSDNAETTALNQYWNNIYNRQGGGLGEETYNYLYNAEINAGNAAIDLANAQVQQEGLAQAATVKSIVDQVRNERMARLRAGMSESQIANQDMQSMIANTNALNESIATANMARLQGQQQKENAQETAYANWLNSMNQAAQAGSAFAAADAGDLYLTALKIKAANPGMSDLEAYDIAQGRRNNQKNNQ